jgi:Phosphoesterase family
MTAVNRRRFLQLAGGATALSVLSPSIARAAAIPADRRTGTLRDVDHIVVLMQENRSFDHYFGTLRGVRGFGDPRPVILPSGKPVWHQSDGTAEVLPFRPPANNLGLRFIQDLPHGWNDGHDAFNNGRYDRWVPAKGRRPAEPGHRRPSLVTGGRRLVAGRTCLVAGRTCPQPPCPSWNGVTTPSYARCTAMPCSAWGRL